MNIILIEAFLIITYTYGVICAMTTAQLEQKINGRLKKMQDDYSHDKLIMESSYQELKSQCIKNTTVLAKDVSILARYFRNQQDEIATLSTLLKKEDDKVNAMSQGIPVGFVYMEMPTQIAPYKLWPEYSWKDITSDYAGLFLRAEGGNLAPFGEIQQANQSWISDMESVSNYYDSWTGPHSTAKYHFPLRTGTWTKNVNPTIALIRSLFFYTTTAENRPINTAVRFWQRVA